MHSRFYRFGSFRLFPTEQLLLREEEAVPLAPKAFELLLALVEGQGRLMRREELLEAVWRDSFVEEINLTVNISLLRKALAAAPDGNSYIVTVPKRGYRFDAPVIEDAGEVRRSVEPAPAVPADGEGRQAAGSVEGMMANPESSALSRQGLAAVADRPVTQITPAESSSGMKRSLGLSRGWSLLLILLLALCVGVWVWHWQRDASIRHNEVHSVAVLPFGYIGSDPAYAYLGLGMTDALVTRLGGQDKVLVRPISAVRRFVGATDLVKAGRDLQVDAVLDGTIQRLAGQTRVTVRLIRVATGKVVWTDTFDQASGNEVALEDAISERLTQSLTIHLSEEEQRRLAVPHTRNPDAYALYTRGRVALNNRSVESLSKSLDLFRGAISADPNYAAAYAGLADAYILAGSYGNSFLAPSVAAPRAEEAVGKALALDNASPEAHTSRAYLRLTYDWDWIGAEAEFREALRLDGSYINAYYWYAHELLSEGRRDGSRPHRRGDERAPGVGPPLRPRV